MQSLKLQWDLSNVNQVCCLLLGLLLLASCAPKTPPPVVERATINARVETDKRGGRLIRIVQSGDTLYSIAFAHSLDVNQLAQWNGIKDTGRLLVGQRIRLTKPIGFKPRPKPVIVKTQVVVNKPNVKPVVTKKSSSDVALVPSVPKQGAESKKVVDSKEVAQKKLSVNESWLWPVRGKVVETFSTSKGQQGIAVEAGARSQVRATKGGEVVYVGNGLKGYGNLVIVKHSEHFLSAYAHNHTTYVSEGQVIKQKSLIGLVGRDNKGRNALHFQIRRDGQPVNPLSFLPKR